MEIIQLICSTARTELLDNDNNSIWNWAYIPIAPAFEKQKQKNQEFKASLGYTPSSRSVQVTGNLVFPKKKIKKKLPGKVPNTF